MIKNTSNQKWVIRPIFDGQDANWWSGPDRIVIDPQSSKSNEFVYRPLVMTQMNRKHQATVFFPLPDGNGLLYTFIGTAEPPKQVVLPTRDVPCKEWFRLRYYYTTLLLLRNYYAIRKR